MERKSKMMKRIWTALLSLLVLYSVSAPVRAAEKIDPNQECSLEVGFSLDDGTDLTGMRFDLYRVAEVREDGTTALCGDFASLNLDISLTPMDAWAAVTSGAANLVRRNGLAPAQSACLDENGVARFPESGKMLLPGIYLVISQTMEVGGKKIRCSPTLVALPMEDGGWNYGVSVKPKGGAVSAEDYLEVLKIWDDKGSEGQRPQSVLVDLYCDDVLVDTQELTAETQWQYRWEPVPVWKSLGQAGEGPGSGVTVEGEHSWYVIERGGDRYEASYTLSGSRRIVITNTLPRETPPSVGEDLPLTGVLWWPVPVLALAGLCLMYLGWGMTKRKRGNE